MNDTGTHITVKVAAYRWLRWPAALTGSVGVWGILNGHVHRVAELSGFFNLPPVEYCYGITVGAAILFALSRCCEQTRRSAPVEDSPQSRPQSWRSR